MLAVHIRRHWISAEIFPFFFLFKFIIMLILRRDPNIKYGVGSMK